MCSSFADEHLEKMEDPQLVELDHLINDSESEWHLYYWITGESYHAIVVVQLTIILCILRSCDCSS